MNYSTLARGIEPDFSVTLKIFGTNVALEQYAGDADLQRAFDALKTRGSHMRASIFRGAKSKRSRESITGASGTALLMRHAATGFSSSPCWIRLLCGVSASMNARCPMRRRMIFRRMRGLRLCQTLWRFY